MMVDVADTAGPVKVVNTGCLRVVGPLERVEIRNIDGDVTIDERNIGPIVITDIHGDVILRRKHGKLHAQRISGRVREELP